jgi:hypothetical protein
MTDTTDPKVHVTLVKAFGNSGLFDTDKYVANGGGCLIFIGDTPEEALAKHAAHVARGEACRARAMARREGREP